MTKHRLMGITLALFAAVALNARPATAQSVAGTWTLSVELDAGSGDAIFVFEVEGDRITGTYSGTLGDQDVTGSIDGDTVRFAFSEAQVGDVTFVGTVEGDMMHGSCSYGLLGEGTFEGGRSGP